MSNSFIQKSFLLNFRKKKVDYDGMTVNERLWVSGQWNVFQRATDHGDVMAIVSIAKSIDLGREWIIPFLIGHNYYNYKIDYKYCMSDAERADVDGEYLKAIKLYTKSMDEGQLALEEYMNLAHLLWRCSLENPSVYRNGRLPVKLDYDVHDKMADVFSRCSQEYAGCSDVEFWAEYYRVSGNWKAHSEEEWLSIIEKYEHYHPYANKLYFVCYLHCKEKYALKMNSFLSECDRCPTALNRFIKDAICIECDSPGAND